VSDSRALRTISMAGVAVLLTASHALADGDAKRGAYIARLGGCHACHTDPAKNDAELVGGLELKSPFGTFRVPNITPDRETGIGGWSTAEFVRAMTRGVAPDGRHYYPAFPYTSYTRMAERDLVDLKAYLDGKKPVRNAVPQHSLRFPYNVRPALAVWKWLFFRPGTFMSDSQKSAAWNRGAYLVTGPAHCGECHTARNFLGATKEEHALAGTRSGPEGGRVPNITPHRKEGIGLWSIDNMVEFLKTGNVPFGEDVGPPMQDYITHNSSHWSEADLKAIAEYLLALPARSMP
jgi:mono/diheme cytochrome c family protein